MTVPVWWRWDGADLLLSLKVLPRSSRDAFVEPQRDRLRLRLTAPPVDGKANRHLVSWLAKQFDVARSAVIIESGQTGPLKRVRITSPGRMPQAIRALIDA